MSVSAHGPTGPPRGGVRPEAFGIGRLFQPLRDGVVVTDEHGTILLWNPAAVRMFGWEPEEAIGQNVDVIIPARMRSRHRAGMARFRATGSGRYLASGDVLELPALRKDGSEIVVEMTLSRIDEERSWVLALMRDVTERVRLREGYDEERRALREANDALEAFSYVVSHDLKEPIRAVDAHLERALEAESPDEAAAWIDRAREANSRLGNLVRALLDWSQASREHVEPVPVDIEAAIESDACRTRFQHVLEERQARLVVAAPLPVVSASPAIVCQVLGNVILNAIKHNPREDPVVVVRAASLRDGCRGVLVEDNGPGFREEVLRRFSQDAMRPGAQGGFGLAIARRAVERLGGRLHLENRPGGGGAVLIGFPETGS